MSNLFKQLEIEAFRAGITPRTKASIAWFRKKATQLGKISRLNLMQEEEVSLQARPRTGAVEMYMFFYDPKGKKTLPYYDRFPKIFTIDKTPDGFIGINLHYLPYVLRAKLMDALYDTVTNAKYDTSTKLGITYKILKGASKFRLFKPTIKRYLNSNVRSRFLYIEPKEWDIALFLPVERFVKASKETVWRESRRAV